MKTPALILLCAMLVPALPAADVTLLWTASATPEVIGYRIYFGNVTGVYTSSVATPNVTQYIITGMKPGTWFFAATAFDADGNESAFSNEVNVKLARFIAPPTQLRIPGPAVKPEAK
jgi:hypothetical protein